MKIRFLALSVFCSLIIAGCGTITDRTASVDDLVYATNGSPSSDAISLSVDTPKSMTALLSIGSADTTICDARHSYDDAIPGAMELGLSKSFQIVEKATGTPALDIVFKGLEAGGGCSLQGQVTLKCTQSVTFKTDATLRLGTRTLMQEEIIGKAQKTEGDFFSACSALGGLHQEAAKSAFSKLLKKTEDAVESALEQIQQQ